MLTMETESYLKIKSFEEFTLLIAPKNEVLGDLYVTGVDRGLADDYWYVNIGDEEQRINMRYAIRERSHLFVNRADHDIPCMRWMIHVSDDTQIMKFYKPYTDWELREYLKRADVYLGALIAKLTTPISSERRR